MSKTNLSIDMPGTEVTPDKSVTKPSNSLTVPEVATELNICVRHAWDEIYSGKLKAFNIGRSVRVRKSALEEYVLKNTIKNFNAKKTADTLFGRK